MKLRAGSQGTGELSRKWGSSEALPTPPGLCAWAGFSVPSGERNAAQFLGSSGNGMLPFFLQHSIPGNRAIPGMPSEHRKQLRAGAAARTDVEVLHAEVRVERVTEPDAPAKRQPLARGIGDGVAEARAAQELGGREGLPVVQHDSLARLPHRDEAPLGHLPARPHQPEPRPQAHGLRLVRAGGTLPSVLQQHRPLRSEPPVLPVVDGHPMGVGDDQAGVRRPAHWELLPGHLHGVPQRHLLGLVDPQVLQQAEDPLVAASSCTQPSARSCSSWDSFSVRSTGAPPKASCTAGNCRKSPSSRNRTRRFVESSAMSAHSHHQPVQRAAPRADGPAHPVVRRLRPQPEVLDAAVRLGDQGDPFAELRELRHDLPRQVRLPRARHAGQQEAVAVEAVLHVAPGLLLRRRLRVEPRLLVLSLQSLHLLEAILGRVVPVAPPGQRLHHMHELSRKALIDQAVGLQRHQVAGRHLSQRQVDPRHLHVLRSHHEIVGGPHGAVGEELRGVDVVVVALAPVVEEDLLVLAAPAVHLVIGGAHGVEDVLGPGPESHESVDGELGHVLLALGPGSLHDLQRPGEAVRRDVGGGVQGPLEVRPGVEHEGRRGLPVPAGANVGQPPDQARAPVLLLAHEGEVRDGVLPRRAGCCPAGRRPAGETVRSCGSGRCPRPDRPCRDRTWPARRPAAAAEASRRRSRGRGDKAGSPGSWRGRSPGRSWIGAVALQAQSLQGLPLAVEGLVDGHDVVRLGRGSVDGRAAQSAEALLLQQQLPLPARLQERSEDLAGGRGEALAPVAEVQLGHPLREHLRVLGVLVDDAVAALGSQAQVPPLHQAAHGHVGLVPLPQQLCPGHVQVLAPEVPGLDLPAPLLPVPEEGHAGLAALAPVAGLVPRFRITEGHGAGVAVEEGVVAVDAAGHGPLLPDGRLVAVEHLPAAVDDVQRRLAPNAELPDLGPGDALALPVLGANRVEVRVDLLVGQAKQLRELAHHAEPILPLVEGTLQNFGGAGRTRPATRPGAG